MANKKYKVVGRSNGHEWILYGDFKYPCCRFCGIVQRKDWKNKPCKGQVKIGLRHKSDSAIIERENK